MSWTDDHTPRPRLFRSADPNKDQTYYLSSVSETALRQVIYVCAVIIRFCILTKSTQTLFPIGNLTKPEVRALAHKYELPTASRDESMGICFVGQKQNFNDFLGNAKLSFTRGYRSLMFSLHYRSIHTSQPGEYSGPAGQRSRSTLWTMEFDNRTERPNIWSGCKNVHCSERSSH